MWGQLVVASGDVIEVCLETEKQVRIFLALNQDQLPKQTGLSERVATQVLKNVFLKSD